VKKPAIFLDRDGTICDEVGYLNHLSRFRLFPCSIDAIRLINQSGRLAVAVTNQGGVAHGYFPESFVHEVHTVLGARLHEGGAKLDGIYYCPHHPQGKNPDFTASCECRKPRTGLLLRAEAELGADLARSWVVGDRYHDIELAWAVGGRGAFVRTGHGAGELQHKSAGWRRPPDLVAENILEAVERILSDPR
jgi:D-glycero-D-manno-heptose 1,7-bisphosphate phosphatase